jgi:hypothetical protein
MSDDDRWMPMESAPINGYPSSIQHVRGKLRDGSIVEDMHYAQDLSGEDQPPFKGWFEHVYAGTYIEVDPVAWMPKPKPTVRIWP